MYFSATASCTAAGVTGILSAAALRNYDNYLLK